MTKRLRAALEHPFVNGGSSQIGSVNKLRNVSHISTCNVLYRIEDLRLVGSFSEHFRETGEDLELSCRIVKARKKLKMLLGFEVKHICPQSIFLLAKKFSKWGRAQAPVFLRHPRQMKSLLFKLVLIGSFICLVFLRPSSFFKAAIFFRASIFYFT